MGTLQSPAPYSPSGNSSLPESGWNPPNFPFRTALPATPVFPPITIPSERRSPKIPAQTPEKILRLPFERATWGAAVGDPNQAIFETFTTADPRPGCGISSPTKPIFNGNSPNQDALSLP